MFVFVVSAMIFMLTYVQRGAQGSLFQGSEAIGLQFDPEDTYTESQRVEEREEIVERRIRTGLIGADLRPPPAGTGDLGLWSLPTGPVFREPNAAESKVTTEWESKSDSTYDDVR